MANNKNVKVIAEKDDSVENMGSVAIKVEKLELSKRTIKALKDAGKNTMLDLCETTLAELQIIKNIGPKGLDDILSEMKNWGYSPWGYESEEASYDGLELSDKEFTQSNISEEGVYYDEEYVYGDDEYIVEDYYMEEETFIYEEWAQELKKNTIVMEDTFKKLHLNIIYFNYRPSNPYDVNCTLIIALSNIDGYKLKQNATIKVDLYDNNGDIFLTKHCFISAYDFDGHGAYEINLYDDSLVLLKARQARIYVSKR